MSSLQWQFWIDVGGTFTDCIGVCPDGQIVPFKTLSSGCSKGVGQAVSSKTLCDPARRVDPPDFWRGAAMRVLDASGALTFSSQVDSFDSATGLLHLADEIPDVGDVVRYELDSGLPAPVMAIRHILRLSPDARCPPVQVRFGTTRGTNALLTRTGARTALVTTKGFGDVPLIGNQDRPDLFALNIRKPQPLFSKVFEINERISADGEVLQQIDSAHAASALREAGLSPDAFDSVAVCLINGYRNPVHETKVESALQQLGFQEISRSTEVSPLIRFVPRCDTTVLDAYLNPVLRAYLDQIGSHLPGSDIQIMTSTGGLVDRERFRGRDCILSGPAGGIVGFSKVAEAEGFARAIGFDMGGTSTDVARFEGQFEIENETTKAGIRLMSPVLAIETVAAGGGSVCGFDGVRLFVGPQSAGADPGPACYGAGGPLTVTDLNVFLGRVLPQHFPFPLNVAAVEYRLSELREAMSSVGVAEPDSDLAQLADGLLQIANDNMVQAIRKVSVAKGYDPSEYALVSFGGAGGQHACGIAERLGIRTVLLHPFAGILSAYGMGQADIRAFRQASVLQSLSPATLETLQPLRRQLESDARSEVLAQKASASHISAAELTLELRYRGTDSSLTVAEPGNGDFREQFELQHKRLFGYIRPAKDIEIASMRVEVVGRSSHRPVDVSMVTEDKANSDTQTTSDDVSGALKTARVFANGEWCDAAVLHRLQLHSGASIAGPAIICEPTSTIFVEPGCVATVAESGCILVAVSDDRSAGQESEGLSASADPVMLEVFNNQFVSIAEQMGETLRRTSTSTNVRERLDFSCALFDPEGRLVVNAPHVPVHLGAMGETVRMIMADHPNMLPGDVFVTNDPYRGGSHLPDVTVVTPVFADDVSGVDGTSAAPCAYVASRAHHAEIGGIVPGSMPPFSTNLAEEGVLIRSQKLVDGGQFCDNELREVLLSGRYPSRGVNDNMADLAAQVAAGECGVQLLREFMNVHAVATVQRYMQHIQEAAARKMRLCLRQLEDRTYSFQDQLDDGSRICVKITVDGEEATVDFTGTHGVHEGNLNANKAITTSAVLYSFRCLLGQDVPLNAGVLEPVTLVIPEGLLNPPNADTPDSSPAMVGGNVETSQRIVDVLLGALGLASASQGTMNNLTFGNESFGYYETICGGAGATDAAAGADAVHTHMTNTRLTDPEVLEQRYPVRVQRFSIRRNSGGEGEHRGGDGVIRELQFLQPLHVSMLSQRRGNGVPYGLNGGQPGSNGINSLVSADDKMEQDLGGCFSVDVQPGDVLRIQTPGGGGFGQPVDV